MEADLVSESPFDDVLIFGARDTVGALRRLGIESYQMDFRQNLKLFGPS